MLRGVTKDLCVLTTEIRSIPVIETNWEQYPYYYKVVAPMFIHTDSGIKHLKKDDYLVWDDSGNFKIFESAIWQNLFGKFLKDNLKGEERIEKKD